jgi:hypothetical protein
MNQLRDIISQAVSSQLQLHKIKEEHGISSRPDQSSDYGTGGRMTDSMADE